MEHVLGALVEDYRTSVTKTGAWTQFCMRQAQAEHNIILHYDEDASMWVSALEFTGPAAVTEFVLRYS
jgi:hypothetical protein